MSCIYFVIVMDSLLFPPHQLSNHGKFPSICEEIFVERFFSGGCLCHDVIIFFPLAMGNPMFHHPLGFSSNVNSRRQGLLKRLRNLELAEIFKR